MHPFWEVARVVGLMVAAIPAAEFGKPPYRSWRGESLPLCSKSMATLTGL